MEFLNTKETTKVRIPEGDGFRWKTSVKNEIINLPEEIGMANGFEKVEPEPKPKLEKPKKKRKSKKK